jgi:hypothetical protein
MKMFNKTLGNTIKNQPCNGLPDFTFKIKSENDSARTGESVIEIHISDNELFSSFYWKMTEHLYKYCTIVGMMKQNIAYVCFADYSEI